jgi:aminoglycoside phosphotransferase (APT) family kinase protein
LADFTYQLMQWRTPKDIRNGFLGVDLFQLGIPSEAEYIEAYCKRTNRDSIPKLDFYFSYNIFRLAGIAQGVYARSLQGNASNSKAAELGALVKPMADYGWQIAQNA